MSYRIIYDPEQDYIAVTVDGDFDLSALKDLAIGVARLVEQYGCRRILNDMRNAKLTGNTFDIYNMPKAAKQAGVEPLSKRALVVSEPSSDFYFLETVFLNQGHVVRMFTDMDRAKQWLLGKDR